MLKYIFIILLASSCYALTLDQTAKDLYKNATLDWKTYHKTISGEEVNISKNEWVAGNMHDWIEENINYKFYWRPRGVYTTWKTKEGDCTDRAMLLSYMLNQVKIKNRLVHGFCNGVLHDWVEYKDRKEWKTVEKYNCGSLIRIGGEVW